MAFAKVTRIALCWLKGLDLPYQMSDSEQEVVAEQAPKKKFKSKTVREDPHRFHAKPRELDLALNALERPKDIDQAQPSKIFSKMPFSSFTLNERLVSTIEKPEVEGGMGLKTCTNIQSVVYPTLLEKRQNMLLKSQTGSGKTMAYLVPIIHDLMTLSPKIERSDGCRTLIMAPTRELCTQIAEVLEKLTKCCVWIVGGCITGGERKKSEKGRLRKGIVVLVGTPGRLLDHLSTTESFLLTKLRWVVLDEVDRLLDMGFEQTVLQIMTIIRGEKVAGLKEKNDANSAKNAKGRALNLQQKWEQQNQAQTKKCAASDDLVLLMCSATLNRAVKHLALPLLASRTANGAQNKGFLVVDADASTVDTIRCEDDILNLGKDSGRLDGNSATAAVLGADGEGPATDAAAAGSAPAGAAAEKRNGSLLDKNSVIEAPAQLAQYFMMVTCKWRLAALLSFLRTHSDQKVVVFLSTCDAVDYLSLLLREMEWPTELDGGDFYQGKNKDDSSSGAAGGSLGGRSIDEEEALATASLSTTASQHLEPLECTFTGVLGASRKFYRLHGNVPQQVRKSVYSAFCAAEKGILLCTDVAARGLDLPNVDWILQYDPPCETADYVHRIGRTARKGRAGCALLFLLPSEAAYIPLLASHGLQPEALSLQSLFVDAGKHIPGSAKFKNVDEMTAVILQRRVERVVHDNKYLLFAGRQAFRSYVRAYATHSTDTKGIFSVQSLHLGHVAKSFGLRESPKALRSSEDVIAKIFNGAYSVHNTRNVRQQNVNSSGDKRGRDGGSSGRDREGGNSNSKKMAHKRSTVVLKDGKRKQADGDGNTGGSKRQRTEQEAAPRSTQNPGVAVKSGRDKMKVRKMSSGGGGAGSGKGSSKGSRAGSGASGSSSSKGSQLTASGVFRKTTGYFKKKLRSQMSSEFSSS